MATTAVEATDWSAYALNYDHMCAHNPAYQDNIRRLLEHLPGLMLPETPQILDVGAGTGNYIKALGRKIPSARLTHLDGDPAMSRLAAEKYRELALDVEIVHADVHEAAFPDGAFDLITCINALYAMPDRQAVLARIHRWLAPGGAFVVIDLGRQMNVPDWVWYSFKEVVQRQGLLAALRAVCKGSESMRQNQRVASAQRRGLYWTHTPEEFREALEASDFDVLHLSTCYRDYADLAVCRKPEGAE